MGTKKAPAQEKRCQEKRRDGTQCQAARLRKSEYCLFHHPWTRGRREELERLGELELRESSQIHEVLAEAVEDVKSGKMTTQQAYALVGLARMLRENLEDVVKEELRRRKILEEQGVGEEPEFAPAENAVGKETATSGAGRNGDR